MAAQAALSVLREADGEALLQVDVADLASGRRVARIVQTLLRKGYVLSLVTGVDPRGRELRTRITNVDPNTLHRLLPCAPEAPAGTFLAVADSPR